MAKLLRTRDRILLGLAITHDILDEVRTVGGAVGSAYKQVYGFVPRKYKKDSLYVTVHRMTKADLIERVIEKGDAKFRITSKGKKDLVRSFPLINLQHKKWDKKWRVVFFDIPEEIRGARDVLRAKLRELGFGAVQKSVFLSAHPFEDDMREFLKSQKLSDFAYLFISDAELSGNVKSLVNKVWKIGELNEEYEELSYKSDNAKTQDSIKEVFEKYTDLIMVDPYLPSELLPRPWWGDRARRAVKKLAKKDKPKKVISSGYFMNKWTGHVYTNPEYDKQIEPDWVQGCALLIPKKGLRRSWAT